MKLFAGRRSWASRRTCSTSAATSTRCWRARAAAVDYDKLLTITNQHLRAGDRAGVAVAARAGRPLVVVYGGALHNDLFPDPTLAKYTFGRAVHAATRGAYREVDLYVPEMVDTTPALKAEPWYRAWQRAGGARATSSSRAAPRSTIVVFRRGARRRLPRPDATHDRSCGRRSRWRLRWRRRERDRRRRRRRRALARRRRDRPEPVGRRRQQRSGLHHAVAEQLETVAGRAARRPGRSAPTTRRCRVVPLAEPIRRSTRPPTAPRTRSTSTARHSTARWRCSWTPSARRASARR